MKTNPWDVNHLPRADNKVFLVTGGNAGIGYFVAEQLATTGATVILGSRNPTKAEAARLSIRHRVPGAKIRHLPLDLADLRSLKTTADNVERLDGLICNAGVLLDHPPRRTTRDGHELMFATNHLGHFALTYWLLPLLKATPGSRVITTGSFTAKSETLNLNDLQSTHDYHPKRTYARSKLAQMLFALELDRRFGDTTTSVLTHPGGALDSLTPDRPIHHRTTTDRLRALPAGLLLQGKEAAAWPAVRAALDPSVRGGQLWGPRAFGLRGLPTLEPVKGPLADLDLATHLWTASAELTGLDF